MKDALGDFRAAMNARAFVDAEDIAAAFAGSVERACVAAGLAEAEVLRGGRQVTVAFTPAHWWEAVVVAPDAYQFYPGFIRDDGVVVWANVWVGENYDLEKFVRMVEQEMSAAAEGRADA